MSDTPAQPVRAIATSLTSAIRRARLEQAERGDVIAELRGAELARLEMLEEAVDPVLKQVPGHIDLFDTGVVPGEHPRLFIDMVAFVEMARDRRTYRFVQDTRNGRVTIAESDRLDAMAEAVTAYIARRLVEREKALASSGAPEPAPPKAVAASLAQAKSHALAAPEPRRRKHWLAESFEFLLKFLGSVTLFSALLLGGYAVWDKYLRIWWDALMKIIRE